MPIRVTVYEWAAEVPEIPISELDWTMYELPRAGDRYWHDQTGYAVREVDGSSDPPRVHLTVDPEWMGQARHGLPDRYGVSGGRPSDRAEWHFEVVDPSGRAVAGSQAIGDDLVAVIREAVSRAVESISRSGG